MINQFYFTLKRKSTQFASKIYSNSNLNSKIHKILNLSGKAYTSKIYYPTIRKRFAEKVDANDKSGFDADFQTKSKVELNDSNIMETIEEWVNSNDVLVFMKGTKEMPRCGFSNYLVQILNFYNIKTFKAVNVLEKEIIRESVKKYSNWPTFPQLYVKGNLIGGCDIVREMHENGTFKELVEREKLN